MERLAAGSSFLFDRPSYRRLAPLACQFGLALSPAKYPAGTVEKLLFIKAILGSSWEISWGCFLVGFLTITLPDCAKPRAPSGTIRVTHCFKYYFDIGT